MVPRQRVLDFLLVLAVVVGLIVWFGGAMPNRDWLWFFKTFAAEPYLITIYAEGSAHELYPGDAGFDQMAASIKAEAAQHGGYMESFYLSETSRRQYQTSGLAVEAAYRRPVKIHTPYFFPEFDRLFIPLQGTYDYVGYPLLFRSLNGLWGGTALVLKSNAGIRAAADAVLAQR